MSAPDLLVMAVVQDNDAANLLQALSAGGFHVTKLASSGGFLREGNTTLMLGVRAERMEALKQLVRENCRARSRAALPLTGELQGGLPASDPLEVEVGGAVLFVLGVQEFVRL